MHSGYNMMLQHEECTLLQLLAHVHHVVASYPGDAHLGEGRLGLGLLHG